MSAIRGTVLWSVVAGFALGFFLAGCGEPPVAEALKRAQAEIDAGQTAEGIQDLEHLLVRAPGNSDVREALAFAQLNAGNASRAAELFNQVGVDKNSDDLLYAAQAYKKANEAGKAVEAYRLYLLSEPNQAEPWNELGQLLVDGDKMPEGIAALAKADELSPDPDLSLQIGELYAQSGNPTQAERYLQSALRQARSSRANGTSPTEVEGEALAQLTQLALDGKKPSEAERHLKQLERDFPKHPKLEELKAKLAAATPPPVKETPKETAVKNAPTPAAANTPTPEQTISNKDTSVPVEHVSTNISSDRLVSAVGNDRQNPDRWVALAKAKENEGDLDWAETAYLEAMRLKPGNGPIIVSYLEVEKARRSPAEFLMEAESQREKYPEIPEIYLITARGYRDLMQNKRNARILFKRFLEKFPNDPNVPTVKAELTELN